jgi:DNA-binding IclR family transcriptional regulator
MGKEITRKVFEAMPIDAWVRTSEVTKKSGVSKNTTVSHLNLLKRRNLVEFNKNDLVLKWRRKQFSRLWFD